VKARWMLEAPKEAAVSSRTSYPRRVIERRSVIRTLRNWLSISHVDIRLEARISGEPRTGNEPGGHRDDSAGAFQLASPVVRAQQLDELGLAVNDGVGRPRANLEVGLYGL